MSEEAKNDTMAVEIEKAIDAMEPTPAPEPQVKPGAETQPVATQEEPKTGTPSTPEAFVADDDLIKRGILAGLDVADVKAFQSKEQAERILAALESKAEPKSQKAKGTEKDDGAGFPADDFEKAVKEMEDAKEVYLTINQVCEMLHIDRSTLWRWQKEGYLSPINMMGRNRYSKAAITKIMEERK